MASSGDFTPKRRFPPPWTVEQDQHGFIVHDANRVAVARVYFNDHLHRERFDNYQKYLTSDEARRIATAISRLPDLMTRNPSFPPRGHPRFDSSRPYHVALEENYVNEAFDEIAACCAHNGIPLRRFGGTIEREGRRWCVYHFARQLDAIQFWDKFSGRWLLQEFLISPERPKDLKPMASLPDHPTFGAAKWDGRG